MRRSSRTHAASLAGVNPPRVRISANAALEPARAAMAASLASTSAARGSGGAKRATSCSMSERSTSRVEAAFTASGLDASTRPRVTAVRTSDNVITAPPTTATVRSRSCS